MLNCILGLLLWTAGGLTAELSRFPRAAKSPCPNLWKLHGNACYYSSNYKATWKGAQSICRSVGPRSDLASFHSPEEQSIITKKIHTELWIGLNSIDRENVWVWSDGSETNFVNWNNGEPNLLDKERCVELVHTVNDGKVTGTFHNNDCNLKRTFVCAIRAASCLEGWEYSRGVCYFISDFKETWQNSRTHCKLLHPNSDLASIHSGDEVTPLTEGMHWKLWIGLHFVQDNQNWKWSDDSKVDFLSWGEGEPNLLDTEQCTELLYNDKWNNAVCEHRLHFSCKLTLSETRVRIKPLLSVKTCPPVQNKPSVIATCSTPPPETLVHCNGPIPSGVKVSYKCANLYSGSEHSLTTFECTSEGKWNPSIDVDFCSLECGIKTKPPGQSQFIVGGEPTLAGDWPWHAALFERKSTGWEYFCGGSLISEKAILTAAHCATVGRTLKPRESSDVLVGLGKHFRKYDENDNAAQFIEVEKVLVYEYYNPTSLDSDVAIIILKRPAQITPAVRPVCIPHRRGTAEEETSLIPGSTGVLVGWGRTESGQLANELLMAELPYVHPQTCRQSLQSSVQSYVRESNFCVGFGSDKKLINSCVGDSGSGMVFAVGSGSNRRYYLFGLVSFGIKDNVHAPCDPTKYSFFTRISVFSHWIVRSLEDVN